MLSAIDSSRSYYFEPPPVLPPPPPVNTTQATAGPLDAAGSIPTPTPTNASSRNTTGTSNSTKVQSEPSFAQRVLGTQPQPGDLAFARMANDVYSDTNPTTHRTGSQSEAALEPGWTRMVPAADGKTLRGPKGAELEIDPDTLDNNWTGLRAAIYADGNGHYVVAYAGTDPFQPGDIAADLQQGSGQSNLQYRQAVDLAKQVTHLAGPGNVAFTGHSLGGGLAATAAAATGAPAVTFNAAGVGNETLRSLGYANPNEARAGFETNGQIRSFSVAGDPLTAMTEHGTPAQLGAQWHAKWTHHPSPFNPLGPIDVHGGEGKDQSYVQIMEQGRFKPGVAQSPLMEQTPVGSDHVGGFLVSQYGNVNTATNGALVDLLQIGVSTGQDIKRDLQSGDKFAFLRVCGELQEGRLQSTGALFDQASDYASRSVTNATDEAGAGIREVGDFLHVPDSVSNRAAGWVENAGNRTRDRIDGAGDQVERAFDRAGNAADWATNKISDRAAEVHDAAIEVKNEAVDWGAKQVEKAIDIAKIAAPIGLKGLQPHWW